MSNESMPALTLGPIKLKDKNNRGLVIINLKEKYGFIPDQIAIQKVEGKRDTFMVSALLTEEELAKEKKNHARGV